MDLKKIKSIIDSDFSDSLKEQCIIEALATDKNVIPDILKILAFERDSKNELITDMNLELSRAHIFIEMRSESKKEAKENVNKTFIIGEIKKFYLKYKSKVGHCFNRFN